ncbi:RNA polymerase sigma factor [Dermacoccus nishinomiyaensis]|uniref:RNA polymerase sigma factor n=1 Tax=Dermacoccus nishinomiyaensis TaxID=1274 RepID=UPI0033BE097F
MRRTSRAFRILLPPEPAPALPPPATLAPSATNTPAVPFGPATTADPGGRTDGRVPSQPQAPREGGGDTTGQDRGPTGRRQNTTERERTPTGQGSESSGPAEPAPGPPASVGAARPPCGVQRQGGAETEREAALARLFERHYTSMLRLAALLGADDPENIVAEAYYEIYRKWRKLRDADRAESYLRSVVCNLTRMRIRHLQIVRKHAETPLAEPVASAEYTALLHDDQQALIVALQKLPPRQREALVLRHWMGLKEGEIAKAMGISAGSVKTHTARGIAALTQVMENRR